jgi:hypothetical protein
MLQTVSWFPLNYPNRKFYNTIWKDWIISMEMKSWCQVIWCICEVSLKADLHYGNYRSKIVPFEAQKIIFYA